LLESNGSITDNEVLAYDTASGLWKNQTPSEAGFATVATTGAYGDLTGRPTLATVATSGQYNDLSGRPALATVATSGSYTDLTNKPTIPTNLDELSDVTITGTPTNSQLIVYDSATSQWKNQDPIVASGLAYKAGYPASKTSTGTLGQICIDGASGTMYICTATNTWQKISLNSANFTNAGGFA
jgi:hypothetical protein